MRPGHRFIGGPLNGVIRACREQYLAVPRYSGSRAMFVGVNDPIPEFMVRESVYKREEIALGMNTRVSVYVDQSMTEDEKWRRLADLIEGCNPCA